MVFYVQVSSCFRKRFLWKAPRPHMCSHVPGTSTTATAITWCQGKEQQIVKGNVSGSMELVLQREVLFSSYVHFKATMKEEYKPIYANA